MNPRALSVETKQHIKRMLEGRQFSNSDIAKTCNVSVATVYRIRDEFGIKTERGKGGRVARTINQTELDFRTAKDAMKSDKKESFCILKDKTIQLVGTKTNYTYTIGLHGDDLQIATGYSEPIKIDLKDAAGFANELADVVETVLEMRKEMWRP